jgi:hypothetical protein
VQRARLGEKRDSLIERVGLTDRLTERVEGREEDGMVSEHAPLPPCSVSRGSLWVQTAGERVRETEGEGPAHILAAMFLTLASLDCIEASSCSVVGRASP